MLEVVQAGVRRSGRWILRDVTWKLDEGECAAIIGPNGSGKSTLSRLLGGVIWPSEGDVRMLGADGTWDSPVRLRKQIRLVQQGGMNEVDGSLTTRQIVWTGFFATLGLYDRPTPTVKRRAEKLLAQVGLDMEADQPYSTLSSGEKMRCLIARAMVVRPRLLILDEPTAGLDLLGREQILATVQRLLLQQGDGTTVVLISHHVEELPPGTSNVLLLAGGHFVANGAPKDVLTSGHLGHAFGVRVNVRHRAGRHYASVHPHAWETLLR
jgi:iron complex transport system ATP-binding protein